MADFVAVLKKTIDGMGETTPQMRARVYDKARSTIAAKLAAIDPPPPEAVAERQKRTLEEAIAAVEKQYEKPAPAPVPASDPLAELENIFSSIDQNRNQPNHARPLPPARVEPTGRQPVPPAARPPAAPAASPVQPPVTKPGEQVLPTLATAAPAAGAAPSRAPAPAAERLVPSPAAADRQESKPVGRAEEFPTYPPASGPRGDAFQEMRTPARARRQGGLMAALIALVVVAGAIYGIWLNADAFRSMFASAGDTPGETVTVEPLAQTGAEPSAADEQVSAPPAQAEPQAEAQTEAPAAAAPAPEAGETPKFTQRLTPEGQEIDAGPAGGESTIGEGTSVVALTTPPAGAQAPAPADPAATQPPTAQGGAPEPATEAAPAETAQPALAVGQKAIFYEERTNVAEGSAEPGSIVWSLVQESPGGDAQPEAAIRAEATIPGKNVQLRMTIRRNADETLPASHIIELIFLTPEGFEGGGIDNILRMAMKTSEQDAGNPLIGIPAKIADGFFLVALNDTKADEQANLTLLQSQDWIDIPVVYKSGRRALITMEKGIPGAKVFDEAMKAWREGSAG